MARLLKGSLVLGAVGRIRCGASSAVLVAKITSGPTCEDFDPNYTTIAGGIDLCAEAVVAFEGLTPPHSLTRAYSERNARKAPGLPNRHCKASSNAKYPMRSIRWCASTLHLYVVHKFPYYALHILLLVIDDG